MRLDIIPGHGSAAVFRVSTGTPCGRVDTIVIDPRNETRPTPDLKTWVEDTGGSRPFRLPENPLDGNR